MTALGHLAVAVPWEFSRDGDYAQWSWSEPGEGRTGAFDALIARTGTVCSWSVRAPGGAVLANGAGATKDECEDLVLQTIGKAFAMITLPLTSMLATDSRGLMRERIEQAAGVYNLADGLRHDMSPLDGYDVVLHLVDGRQIPGTLRTGQWSLVVTDGHLDKHVHPSMVAAVERIGAAR